MDTKEINIKAELKALGLSQTVLARRLRCSIPFLNQVIYGVRISRRIQGGVAAYLGKNVSELWPTEQKNTPAPADGKKTIAGEEGRTPDPSRG